MVAPVVDVWNWTGFYVGGNAGYSWGRADTDSTQTATSTVRTRTFRGFGTAQPTTLSDVTTLASATALASARTDVNGGVAGVQAGYNWQTGRFVLGVEGDFQWSGQRGDVTFCPVGGCVAGAAFASASHGLDWFGTLRGRLGVTADRFMLYATGGLAYGHLSSDYSAGFVGGPGVLLSVDQTRAGWTIGAGIEAFLARNWTMKVEYLYVDLGSFSGANGSATTSSTLVRPNTPTVDITTVIDTTTVLNSSIGARFTDNIVRVGPELQV